MVGFLELLVGVFAGMGRRIAIGVVVVVVGGRGGGLGVRGRRRSGLVGRVGAIPVYRGRMCWGRGCRSGIGIRGSRSRFCAWVVDAQADWADRGSAWCGDRIRRSRGGRRNRSGRQRGAGNLYRFERAVFFPEA